MNFYIHGKFEQEHYTPRTNDNYGYGAIRNACSSGWAFHKFVSQGFGPQVEVLFYLLGC